MIDSPAFLLGHAQANTWQDAVAACLRQLEDIPTGTNLGFVYATDSFAENMAQIVERLRAATGVLHWTGTVGMGICATGKEYHQRPALVVMLATFPNDSFRVLPFYNRAADRLPASWEPWLDKTRAHLGVLYADPANNNLARLFERLADELPGGYLVGGLSSSHGAYPQVADGIHEGGLSGIVFNGDVTVVSGMTQGCTPIAGTHTITDCDNNIVNTLDDAPALDVLKQDIGEILARDLNRAAGYIFAGLPVEHDDSGDYLVRNLIGVDTQGKRIAIGDMIHTGQRVQFCRRDGKSAWEDMQRMLDELKTRIGEATPKGGLYYSCLGRGEALFGDNSEELTMIRDTLGDFPLAGFFANGEISNRRLYGYTGVLTLFL